MYTDTKISRVYNVATFKVTVGRDDPEIMQKQHIHYALT